MLDTIEKLEAFLHGINRDDLIEQLHTEGVLRTWDVEVAMRKFLSASGLIEFEYPPTPSVETGRTYSPRQTVPLIPKRITLVWS